jgi:hypothetical protein
MAHAAASSATKNEVWIAPPAREIVPAWILWDAERASEAPSGSAVMMPPRDGSEAGRGSTGVTTGTRRPLPP